MGFSHKVLLQDFTGIFDDATGNKIPELRNHSRPVLNDFYDRSFVAQPEV